ncbi:MAG: hypothetical protein P1U56_25300 [Saprospiraceae bacterium]|nr:hypothetical protein [Saprospiraceae bacterium]
MNRIKKLMLFWNTIKFSIINNPTYSILFGILAVCSILIAVLNKSLFDNYIDPITGIMTLVVAIGIALLDYNKQWLDSLPKTLTVHFILKNQYVLTCYYADLVSEGDIRNWAQQLGSQMTGGSRLDFEPFFDIDQPSANRLESNASNVLHYTLKMYLKSELCLNKKTPAFNKEEWTRWYICHGEKGKMDEKKKLDPLPSTSNPKEPDFKNDVLPLLTSTNTKDDQHPS